MLTYVAVRNKLMLLKRKEICKNYIFNRYNVGISAIRCTDYCKYGDNRNNCMFIRRGKIKCGYLFYLDSKNWRERINKFNFIYYAPKKM